MIKFFKKEKVKSIKNDEEFGKELKLLQEELRVWNLILEKENQIKLELYNKIIKKVDNLLENGILPKVIIYGYQIGHIRVQKNDDYIGVAILNDNIEDKLGQELSLRLYSYISGSIPCWETYLEELIPPPPLPPAPDQSKSI